MNNPFDWKNYKPVLSFKDMDTARKTSFQQTTVINRKRAKGIEPSIVYSPKGMDTEPKKFVADMPIMPVHASTVRRNKK